MNDLAQLISSYIASLFNQTVEVEISRPEPEFGDASTNIALKLAKPLQKAPREIADLIAAGLSGHPQIASAEVAGPGFINIRFTDATLVGLLKTPPAKPLQNQEMLVEFSDANPFKAMHLGHLYSTIAGDAISGVLEANGATVRRISYHGDVGMHVARAIWAVRQDQKEHPEKPLEAYFETDTTIGNFYAKGARAYKESDAAKAEIETVNRQVYEYVLGKGDNGAIGELYEFGRSASFAAFDKVFKTLDVQFSPNGRYLESKSTVFGLEFVKQNTGKVFEESDGAVVYKGEKVGLHTRVFINSKGLPTYEAKDLGLAEMKHRDYPNAAQSIIITANEQTEYFKVMLAALAEINPEVAAKSRHVAHGFLSLVGGKMSSRNGISDKETAAYLLASVKETIQAKYPEIDAQTQNDVYLAAVKYTFLKNRIGGDIVFDVDESISTEGNSGPYVQYAHARARSILAKSSSAETLAVDVQFDAAERSLAVKLTEWNDVLQRAGEELLPHLVCTYLYELSQVFNRFYEKSRVIGDPREVTRLGLIAQYANVLQTGLITLGIPAPERL